MYNLVQQVVQPHFGTFHEFGLEYTYTIQLVVQGCICTTTLRELKKYQNTPCEACQIHLFMRKIKHSNFSRKIPQIRKADFQNSPVFKYLMDYFCLKTSFFVLNFLFLASDEFKNWHFRHKYTSPNTTSVQVCLYNYTSQISQHKIQPHNTTCCILRSVSVVVH